MMRVHCCVPHCLTHDQGHVTSSLQAALGADMRCIITYTSSTATEAFEGAERIFCESHPDSKSGNG